MKFFALRTVFAAALATLLAACGSGGIDAGLPTQTASMSGSATLATSAMAVGAADLGDAPAALAAAMPASGAQVIAANTPAPDCAAEGCSGLRIIDGNAEAYRYEALRRASAEPQS